MENTEYRREMIERCKKQMLWIASIKNFTVKEKLDRSFEFMQGFELAFQCTDAEFDDFTKFWEDLRIKIRESA